MKTYIYLPISLLADDQSFAHFLQAKERERETAYPSTIGVFTLTPQKITIPLVYYMPSGSSYQAHCSTVVLFEPS